MTPDLRALYQETIIDHGRRPRNFGELPDANRRAEGYNPLCGDHLHMQLRVRDGHIEEARFDGSGCAISTASASLLTEAVKGLSEAEASRLFERFHALLTTPAGDTDPASLGKLAVLAGVREFPGRVKCATLAWHTLLAALRDDGQAVSSE